MDYYYRVSRVYCMVYRVHYRLSKFYRLYRFYRDYRLFTGLISGFIIWFIARSIQGLQSVQGLQGLQGFRVSGSRL